MKTKVLNSLQCKQKIKRMAFQILEDNYDQEKIILAGIKRRGLWLAEHLAKEIRQISSIEIIETKIRLNKKNPVIDAVEIIPEPLADVSIIIVDDVANSGRTLLYALKPFLNGLFKKIRIAVLIDRKHKAFPIAPDFVGYSLATTLQQNIEVDFLENGEIETFLS